jgi:hypothetical protein
MACSDQIVGDDISEKGVSMTYTLEQQPGMLTPAIFPASGDRRTLETIKYHLNHNRLCDHGGDQRTATNVDDAYRSFISQCRAHLPYHLARLRQIIGPNIFTCAIQTQTGFSQRNSAKY